MFTCSGSGRDRTRDWWCGSCWDSSRWCSRGYRCERLRCWWSSRKLSLWRLRRRWFQFRIAETSSPSQEARERERNPSLILSASFFPSISKSIQSSSVLRLANFVRTLTNFQWMIKYPSSSLLNFYSHKRKNPAKTDSEQFRQRSMLSLLLLLSCASVLLQFVTQPLLFPTCVILTPLTCAPFRYANTPATDFVTSTADDLSPPPPRMKLAKLPASRGFFFLTKRPHFFPILRIETALFL